MTHPDAPEQHWPLLRKLIPGNLQPFLRGLRKRAFRPRSLKEPYYTVFPYTQAALVRQENLVRMAEDIESNQIPGAIVECGVLDGGTAALMASATSQSGRTIHLFDSWSGLPKTSAQDGTGSEKWIGDVVGSPRRVTNVMKKLNVDHNRIMFHKGWFHQTFPAARIEKIALLHIDADFYDSVRLCLQKWYPVVVPGGYMQFDDYGVFIGCTRAVDEFLKIHTESKLQSTGNPVKAYFIQKPSDIHDHRR